MTLPWRISLCDASVLDFLTKFLLVFIAFMTYLITTRRNVKCLKLVKRKCKRGKQVVKHLLKHVLKHMASTLVKRVSTPHPHPQRLNPLPPLRRIARQIQHPPGPGTPTTPPHPMPTPPTPGTSGSTSRIEVYAMAQGDVMCCGDETGRYGLPYRYPSPYPWGHRFFQVSQGAGQRRVIISLGCKCLIY